MAKRRTFTAEFKTRVVLEIISGVKSSAEICREYNLKPQLLSRWKAEYHQGKFFENTNPDTTRLEIRVRELERLIGELTLENRTLKKMVELVEPQKKDMHRIYTSADWERSRKDAR